MELQQRKMKMMTVIQWDSGTINGSDLIER